MSPSRCSAFCCSIWCPIRSVTSEQLAKHRCLDARSIRGSEHVLVGVGCDRSRASNRKSVGGAPDTFVLRAHVLRLGRRVMMRRIAIAAVFCLLPTALHA